MNLNPCNAPADFDATDIALSGHYCLEDGDLATHARHVGSKPPPIMRVLHCATHHRGLASWCCVPWTSEWFRKFASLNCRPHQHLEGMSPDICSASSFALDGLWQQVSRAVRLSDTVYREISQVCRGRMIMGSQNLPASPRPVHSRSGLGLAWCWLCDWE
jgi:hypothetical protein